MTAHLQKLNPEQLEAVQHLNGPILVLAGAGSGKTRVLTHRVANLVLTHNVSSRRILAVTFTNKAASEMKERLHNLLGPIANDLWVSTFHSTALRILRSNAEKLGYTSNFVIYDDQDTKSVLKSVLKKLNIDDKKFPVQMYQSAIDKAKNHLKSPSDFGLSFAREMEVYQTYQDLLKTANAMDFGDLLLNVVTLFRKFPDTLDYYQDKFEYVLVDEFQDTNPVQYLFLKQLVQKNNNLLAVGDDDQSIYAFRGADIRNILSFERDFSGAKVVKLEQNYRSTQNILDLANAVISKNKDRKSKVLWTDSNPGELVKTYAAKDEIEEARFIASQIAREMQNGTTLDKIGVFYRTNAQSRAIEESLVQSGIPYRIYGGLKFYDRAEIKDVLAYLKLIVNPSDRQAFLRIVNTPTRGIGAKTVGTLLNQADAEAVSVWDVAEGFAAESPKIAKFVELISGLREQAKSLALSELISVLLERSGYEADLKKMRDASNVSRMENLQELIAIAHNEELEAEDSWQCLCSFLDKVSLTAGSDQALADDAKAVSLMTLHLAKGLEFDVVFLTGLEEGLLPHQRSKDEPGGIEEERRLCYVGITRAMKRLILSRVRRRGMFFSYDTAGLGIPIREPSRFIYDMPESLLESVGGDFLSNEFVNIEIDPYMQTEDIVWQSSKKIKKSTPFLVQSADSLQANDMSKHKMLLATEIEIGMEIIHPYLGNGRIVELQGDPIENPNKAKISVDFNNSLKKLIWAKANLHRI